MTLSDVKAREVLELCLSSEDPKMRSRVYQIIEKSGLAPSDPMFLVLALTGQMRVFLEDAPKQLCQLLIDWKQQNAGSLAEITRATAETKDNYNDLSETLKQSLKNVSKDCVSDIKDVGMATVSAIAEANTEALDRIHNLQLETKNLINETQQFHDVDKGKYRESIIVAVDRYQQISLELRQANIELKRSTLEVKKFQQQVSWSKGTEWFTPLFALLIAGIAGFMIGIIV